MFQNLIFISVLRIYFQYADRMKRKRAEHNGPMISILSKRSIGYVEDEDENGNISKMQKRLAEHTIHE